MSQETSSDAVLMENASRAHQSQRKTVLGLGVACVDIIACVDTYPEPDEKIRAESVQLFSGGNVGNTLTAISRLGAVNTKVLTKVGSDPNGEVVLNDFRSAMIDVKDVIISTSAATLLVYVIVDKQARRTCIASPNEEELTQSEIVSKLSIRSQICGLTESCALFDNVQVRHFDAAESRQLSITENLICDYPTQPSCSLFTLILGTLKQLSFLPLKQTGKKYSFPLMLRRTDHS